MGTNQPEGVRRHSPGRVLVRFLSGRPLDGYRRTDSIFIRPGRTSLDPSGHASKWSYLAGYQRLLVRLAVAYLAAWALVLCFAYILRISLGSYAPDWAGTLTPGHVLVRHLLWSMVLGSLPGTFWAVRTFGLSLKVPDLRIERGPFKDLPGSLDLKTSGDLETFGTSEGLRVRVLGGPVGKVLERSFDLRVLMDGWTKVEVPGRRTWDRTKVRPVAAAAQSVLGTSEHLRRAKKWVHVPRSFRHPHGSPVVLHLPGSFHGADDRTKARLVRAVGSRLGLADPEAQWELEGHRPRVLISAPPLPPSLVTYEDVRADLEALPEYTMFLGLAAKRKVLTTHLAGDSPHIALSAGSGAGKSELIKVMIMLALRWGWGVIILDWKEVSQQWVEDLPGVLYVRDEADIHDMGERLGAEVVARKRLYRQDKAMPGKANVLIVCEEMNVTAPLLHDYWARLRSTAEPEEKRSMPTRSPGLDGLMKTINTGRQFGMFVLYIAQRMSARVTNNNADLRESFGTRLLGRATTQTWTMLAPHIKPVPKMGTEPGRWAAVIGQGCTIFQGALITDDEAREFATGGAENPSSPFSGSHGMAGGSREHVAGAQGIPLPRGAAEVSEALEGEISEEVTRIDARKLSEMVDGLEHLGITLKVLQKAAGDPDSGFPGAYGGTPNNGYTYDFGAVREWVRRRDAARVAKKGRK